MRINNTQDIKKTINQHIEDILNFIAENKLPEHLEYHYEGMVEAYMNTLDYLETIEIKGE